MLISNFHPVSDSERNEVWSLIGQADDLLLMPLPSLAHSLL